MLANARPVLASAHPGGKQAADAGLRQAHDLLPAERANIAPSARGELEITDVNRKYLEQGQLSVEIMGRGFAWLDTGTHLQFAGRRQLHQHPPKAPGFQVSCPEAIAYGQKWITTEQLLKLATPLTKNGYGRYLLGLVK